MKLTSQRKAIISTQRRWQSEGRHYGLSSLLKLFHKFARAEDVIVLRAR
jgi:hypothetical protein